ncbi:MAG: CoA-binding protein [Bacteroidota bacterium]
MSKYHTLVLGASPNSARISYQAIVRLVHQGHPVTAIGVREGSVAGVPIQLGTPQISDVHTLTLYLNPKRQEPLYDYIIGLQPKRIIFNPGTENAKLVQLAQAAGIETEIACTLVLLATDSYAEEGSS